MYMLGAISLEPCLVNFWNLSVHIAPVHHFLICIWIIVFLPLWILFAKWETSPDDRSGKQTGIFTLCSKKAPTAITDCFLFSSVFQTQPAQLSCFVWQHSLTTSVLLQSCSLFLNHPWVRGIKTAGTVVLEASRGFPVVHQCCSWGCKNQSEQTC